MSVYDINSCFDYMIFSSIIVNYFICFFFTCSKNLSFHSLELFHHFCWLNFCSPCSHDFCMDGNNETNFFIPFVVKICFSDAHLFIFLFSILQTDAHSIMLPKLEIDSALNGGE
jgi:hypothetical protein